MPLWEELINKAGKLHQTLRSVLSVFLYSTDFALLKSMLWKSKSERLNRIPMYLPQKNRGAVTRVLRRSEQLSKATFSWCTSHTYRNHVVVSKQNCLSVERRPPTKRIRIRRHAFLLLWPWPWPNDLDIRTLPDDSACDSWSWVFSLRAITFVCLLSSLETL